MCLVYVCSGCGDTGFSMPCPFFGTDDCCITYCVSLRACCGGPA